MLTELDPLLAIIDIIFRMDSERNRLEREERANRRAQRLNQHPSEAVTRID